MCAVKKSSTRRQVNFLGVVLGAFLLTLILTACSSIEYDAETVPRMLVSQEKTSFFKHGPAQWNGPDRTLPEGEDVTVICRESGYSRVKLSDGETGYVANEALVSAPPMPASSDVPVEKVGDSAGLAPSFRY